MKTYMVDVTLSIVAASEDDALFIANSFCEAASRSPEVPEGVQVEYVSEPEVAS